MTIMNVLFRPAVVSLPLMHSVLCYSVGALEFIAKANGTIILTQCCCGTQGCRRKSVLLINTHIIFTFKI